MGCGFYCEYAHPELVSRSSVAELAQYIVREISEGVDGIYTVIERKIAINLRTVKASIWRVVVIAVAIGALFLARRAPERFRTLNRRLPALGAVLPGVLVGTVLGYAVNDSGVAVPGMMLAIAIPGIVYLVSRAETT